MPKNNVSQEFITDCKSLGVEHALQRWRFSLSDLAEAHTELGSAALSAIDALNVLYRTLGSEGFYD